MNQCMNAFNEFSPLSLMSLNPADTVPSAVSVIITSRALTPSTISPSDSSEGLEEEEAKNAPPARHNSTDPPAAANGEDEQADDGSGGRTRAPEGVIKPLESAGRGAVDTSIVARLVNP